MRGSRPGMWAAGHCGLDARGSALHRLCRSLVLSCVPAFLLCARCCAARSLSVFYSRSSSRASSGELSRQSWGSMRGLSLGHGPHILGGSGGGVGMQSPSGSLGRVSGAEMMAAAAAGKCSSLHSSASSSRPRSGQRPISAATAGAAAAAAAGASPRAAAAAAAVASPAAVAPAVRSASQLAAGGSA
jgi:hypothetical protein